MSSTSTLDTLMFVSTHAHTNRFANLYTWLQKKERKGGGKRVKPDNGASAETFNSCFWPFFLPIVNTTLSDWPLNSTQNFTSHLEFFSVCASLLSLSLSIVRFFRACIKTNTDIEVNFFHSYLFTHYNQTHNLDPLWISDECLLWGNGDNWNALNWQHGHHYVV